MVILCIDTFKVEAKIKWEDLYDSGIEYHHIYGLLNLNFVVNVVPFLKDKNGDFILNKELKQYTRK